MLQEPSEFYDKMAPYYHLLFPSGFEAGISDHADTIHKIVSKQWGENVRTVLDVSCGIGTQAIGLAQKGYIVSGSDISERAIHRAKEGAAERGLRIKFSVADMRQAFDHHRKRFDLVLSVDNGLTYLLTDGDILCALRQIYQCCRPGGGFVASVHDYEIEDKSSRQIRPYGIREEGGSRYFIFQVWEYDGPIIDLSVYVVKDSGDGAPETQVMHTKSYAIGTGRLMELIREAGFDQVKKLTYTFAQPILLAVKRGEQ